MRMYEQVTCEDSVSCLEWHEREEHFKQLEQDIKPTLDNLLMK